MTTRGDGMTAIAIGVLALGLAQCDRGGAPTETPAPPTTVASASPSLGRSDLLAALDRAASAHASGQTTDDGLSGRTFLFKLAFACPGETVAPTPGTPSLTRSSDGRRLELSLAPADWTRSPLVLAPGEAPSWERVDGLWITRPWISAEGCPASMPAPRTAPAPDAASNPSDAPLLDPIIPIPMPPSPMTAGLALIADGETSRLGRRAGEAWSHAVRGEDGGTAVASPSGYRVVLGGRIGRFPDGRAVRCSSDGPDRRPVCIAAVELDLVAFEDASGDRLSEWRPT